ncbi:hypothetical protein HOI26_04520 [Candidatus Woesearchaeota archaeon]|jgi:prefoldin beta subunit|nr:hypothetical protein [Candidatus Woesearchaeota archaeon]MBT5740334.1 hypothetical protein [Candidatus Woesearchaeota archaeon]
MSDHIRQLQLAQHNLQHIQERRQFLQTEIVELNSALNELETTDKAYRIVGKLMIATPTDKAKKNVSEQKEKSELRLKNFKIQEQKLQEQIEELQKQAVAVAQEKNEQ